MEYTDIEDLNIDHKINKELFNKSLQIKEENKIAQLIQNAKINNPEIGEIKNVEIKSN